MCRHEIPDWDSSSGVPSGRSQKLDCEAKGDATVAFLINIEHSV